MGGDGVGQAAGLIDAGQRGQDLGRYSFVEFDVLVELGQHRAHQYLGLALIQCRGLQQVDVGGEVVLVVEDFVDRAALCTFDQDLDGAIRQLQHLQDGRQGADAVDVIPIGVVLPRVLLRHQQNFLVVVHRRLERGNRFGSADK